MSRRRRSTLQLNYFHAHRFRSRAVIEFGAPIDIPNDFVDLFSHGGQDKRDAIGKVMELVFDGLKSVTVRAPDYETLMVSGPGDVERAGACARPL